MNIIALFVTDNVDHFNLDAGLWFPKLMMLRYQLTLS